MSANYVTKSLERDRRWNCTSRHTRVWYRSLRCATFAVKDFGRNVIWRLVWTETFPMFFSFLIWFDLFPGASPHSYRRETILMWALYIEFPHDVQLLFTFEKNSRSVYPVNYTCLFYTPKANVELSIWFSFNPSQAFQYQHGTERNVFGQQRCQPIRLHIKRLNLQIEETIFFHLD